MIQIKNKAKCCGCTACANICPQQCISMIEDNEGFLYPSVDASNCIKCNLCERVCPELYPFEAKKPLEVHAARIKEEDILILSSSGGMFWALANKIINMGGVVFGAMFDDEWEVYHNYTDSNKGLTQFQGSKYVQSSIGDSYKKVKSFLKDGRWVLFSGTPCQVAGLNHFLGRRYDNLITADIICHGVPSRKVWRNYLNEIKEKCGYNKVKIERISFRDKRTGWKKYSFVLSILGESKSDENKKESYTLSSIHLDNDYMKGFSNNYYIRPSCYSCKARLGRSHSDFTLADFWKSEKYMSDDDKGMSLLLINSAKGKSFFPFNKVDFKQLNYQVLLDSNPSFFNSHGKTYKRKQFWKNYFKTNSLEYSLKAIQSKKIDLLILKLVDIYYRIRLRYNMFFANKIK